jgi:glycosyltransferase involved in cell wall biosynthesis
MRILWLTWKDRDHPDAGGAEVVNEALAERLATAGHEILFVTAGFRGAPAQTARAGFRIVRVGGRLTVYWHARRHYRRHLRDWPDLVIDEVNTIPFFAKHYVRQPNLLFVHQLCRAIWFYQMPFPLSLIGWLAEPLYLRLLNDRRVITVSESTRRDLVRHGFRPQNIAVISEGLEAEPVERLAAAAKTAPPVMLSLGAMRPMKRTLHIVEAFELAKANHPDLRLWLAGDDRSPYGRKVLRRVETSPFRADIRVFGRVDAAKKRRLLREAHLLAVTSVKEGWGLVVTEANSQGTPAVVYDADGLRDSVRHGETGYVTRNNTPESLAAAVGVLLSDPVRYASLRDAGWRWSRGITFDLAAAQLLPVLVATTGDSVLE